MDIEKIIKRIQRVSLSCDLKTEEGIRHFHNGHEYVEIGGIKWATKNVGANSITDYGLYFQWGDTQGYTADQVGCEKCFDWANYKYSNSISRPNDMGMSKYNETDGKKVLDLEDDAARANWGGSWRMPTEEEFKTLMDVATYRWVADYQGSGVAGVVCTDKNDSSKVLFFPTAGFANNEIIGHVGSYSYYWSSSLYISNAIGGRNLFFGGGNCRMHSYCRCCGFPVRGVVKK